MIKVKRRYTDPYLVIMGDFNQWDLAGALSNFGDLAEAHGLATRGSRSIDRVFTNFGDCVRQVRALPPPGDGGLFEEE